MYQTLKKKYLNKYTIDVLYFTGKDIQTSDNPIFLSFQVTKIGIFTEAQVIELLGLELTNLRLQRELHYINNLVRNIKN